MALALSHKKLAILKDIGIDGLISICPFCSVMYESNQKKIEKTYEEELGIPVIYYTQILGLAMGFSSEDMGLKLNRVKAKKLIEAFTNEK